MSRNMMMSNKI
jgi:DNA replication initiation complex subunit (GINS family)